jgi:hypothetical protein
VVLDQLLYSCRFWSVIGTNAVGVFSVSKSVLGTRTVAEW